MASVIKQYYGEENLIPKEIIVGLDLGDEGKLIEFWLSETTGRKVPITRPIRGRKKELLLLAEKNAHSQFEMSRSQIIDQRQVLEKIQRRLHLANYPHQIECFDISNIQGAFPVASQIRFTDGDPDSSGYRHYKIKTVEGQDDFASMKEVLTRRFLKTKEEAPWPDLLMIDGGKGQLNIALSVMDELEISGPDVIGFTKIRKPGKEEPEDMAYLPGRKNPVHFRKGGDDLFLLQRVRDESHRFAIEFHRKLRAKAQRQSILDEIEGIGPAKKKALLKHFGSVKRIAAAAPEDLAAVKGINRDLAETIHRMLTGQNGG
jgi:excinuclease ABC subunit C